MSLENQTRSRAAIQEWLKTQLAESLAVHPSEIDVREPFASYGLSSVAAIGLTADLEEWLETRLEPTLAWDYPTIEALASYLADGAGQASAG